MPEVVKRTIQKVALAEGRTLKIELKEHLSDGTFRDVKYPKCDQLYHEDMKVAFEKLKSFLVDICDQKEKDLITDPDGEFIPHDCLDKIEVHAISVGGSAEAEGVVISGTKVIGLKVLKLDSPMTEFDGDYPKGAELAEVIEAIRFEASEYLFGGKYAIKQLEMDFPDENAIDKETSEVAKEVLGQIGENIFPDIKKRKGKGKNKHMSIVTDVQMSEAM